jgi:ribose transport system substrate-binding protein
MDSIDEYGLELLASETANWETEKALSLVSDLITAHPDVDGIMCANDSMALGAVQAVEAAGRTGEILVVGFDNISAAQELMREGKLLATVDQFADKQAAKGIEFAMNMLDGESYSGWVKTDVVLVLPEDVEAGGDGGDVAEDEKPVVALIMKSLANEFFKTMQEGAEAYATQRGDLELRSWGIDNETDVEGQISLVEDAISQEVDAIVIAMIDPQAILPKLKEAADAGIEVITIDVMPDQGTMEELGLDLPFIGPDNREGAKLSGDVLGEALGEGGQVFIIEGNPGVPNAEARKQGFMDSIDEYGLELLASETANWETEKALSLVSDLITANPDVDGIMCANDSMALGAVQAVEAAGRTGEILVVGFDNISAAQELMREGKLLATVDQFADKQAAKGIEFAMNMLDGESYSGWVKTDVVLVLPEDVE